MKKKKNMLDFFKFYIALVEQLGDGRCSLVLYVTGICIMQLVERKKSFIVFLSMPFFSNAS